VCVTEAAIEHAATPTVAKTANVFAKGSLVLLLVLALLYPDQGNLRDKAAGMRAVGYPLISFTLPMLWWALWRDRMAFPWEVAEFFAFISRSTEREFAYADTLGDLSLGVAGAVVAAVVIHRSWRRGRLLDPEPLPPRVAV
jgi:hypothetical protein